MLDKGSKELATGNDHDIDTVLENGEISGRDQERDLGESGIERLDVDDDVPLVRVHNRRSTSRSGLLGQTPTWSPCW